MTSIWDRSATASSNNSTPPAGFPEGQVPSLVDDQFRAEMAYVTEFVHSIAATGTGSTITVSFTNPPASLTDGMEIHVRAAHANSVTAPVLTTNATGDTGHTVTKLGGTALVANDIAGNLHELDLRYNLANTRWELLNPALPFSDATNGGLNIASGLIKLQPSDLATKSAPTSSDSVVIMDAAASNAAKTATISTLFKQPTRTVLTSGTSATYTTPTGATRIYIRMVGGGGGGAGSGTGPGGGTDGTASTFGAGLTANGGAKASSGSGSGGAATGGDLNFTGATGGGPSGLNANPGGAGGATPLGGAGPAGVSGPGAGGNAIANTGSGGGGAGDSNTVPPSGGGGGAGGYLEKLITSPAATYTYTVGAGGSGGAAGSSGAAGGNGAAGVIIIDEYYN